MVLLGVSGFALARTARALPTNCSQTGRAVTCSFGFTGSEQQFAVPAGVTSLQVSAVGAPGGGSLGGVGGTASAAVTVTPGDMLYVEVGGAGTSSAGGFNGGGDPGANSVSTPAGAGGGGASDVRRVPAAEGGSLASRLIVAGGGGGAGGLGLNAGPAVAGGAADADGTDGRNDVPGDTGGGGGHAGDTGGAAGAAGTGTNAGSAGGAGSSGVGGAGGPGGGSAVTGGGGGGGQVGGGGGGSGGWRIGDQAGGGGGGGGSSLASGGTTGVADSTSTAPSVTIAYTAPDTTAPAISIAAPAANGGYQLGSSVAASYSCADENGGSGLATCQGPVASGAPIDTSTSGIHTFSVTATDSAGNAATKAVAYDVFGAPTASVTAPAPGGTFAVRQVVHTQFACAEGPGGPGVVQCADSTGTNTSPGIGASKSGSGRLDTSAPGPHTYTVTAVSADGLTAQTHFTYTVAAAPSITITAPAANHKYELDQAVNAAYTCKDGKFGSGIKSCKGTVRKGSPINTKALGSMKFSVTAVSRDGQKTTKTVSYAVTGSIASAPRFYLQIAGQDPVAFTQLVGIQDLSTTCSSLPPGLNTNVKCQHHLPPEVTLIAPVNADNFRSLFSWRKEVRAGRLTAAKDATIGLYAAGESPGHGHPSIVYQLHHAWPKKVQTSSLKAGTSSVTLLTVTLVAESIIRSS